MAWIDTAKGACIALVVLGHSASWYSRNFAAPDPFLWDQVTLFLAPLRMPLFFAISGMLAASKMSRPLRNSFKNTGGLYIIYVLWSLLLCMKLALPGGREGLSYPSADQILLSILLPTNLWYLWALPAFYLIAWWLDRLFGKASVYALIPFLGLSIAAYWIDQATMPLTRPPLDPSKIGACCYELFWFYLGLKGREYWPAAVARGKWWRALLASAAFVIVNAWLWRHGLDLILPIVVTPLALWAAIEALGALHPQARIARLFGALGRKTLPVYVLHIYVLTGMTMVARILHLRDKLGQPVRVVELLATPIVAAGVIATCLLIDRLAAPTSARILLVPLQAPPRFRFFRPAPTHTAT